MAKWVAPKPRRCRRNGWKWFGIHPAYGTGRLMVRWPTYPRGYWGRRRLGSSALARGVLDWVFPWMPRQVGRWPVPGTGGLRSWIERLGISEKT